MLMVKNTEFGDDIDWNERKKFHKNWKRKPLELDQESLSKFNEIIYPGC